LCLAGSTLLRKSAGIFLQLACRNGFAREEPIDKSERFFVEIILIPENFYLRGRVTFFDVRLIAAIYNVKFIEIRQYPDRRARAIAIPDKLEIIVGIGKVSRRLLRFAKKDRIA